METTRTERIRLGIFLLLCLSGVFTFVGFLIGEKVREQKVSYYAIFSESVQGLSIDARVMLNGIDVGRVKKIEIDHSNLNQVVVSFEVNPETPIKAGTSVQMTSGISLTGNRYLILTGGDAAEENLPEGSQVKVGVNRMSEITGQAENLMERIESLLANLNQILSEDNAKKISRTLTNLETVSMDTKAIMADGKVMMKGGKQLVSNTNGLVEEGREFIKSTEGIIHNLDSITHSFKDAHLAEELKKLTQELNEKIAILDTKGMNEDLVSTLHSIEAVAKRIDLFIYKNQNSLSDGVSQVNEILDNVNELSQKLKNDPSSLIRGGAGSDRE